jgi:UDP-N-acetylglucosamine 1-carboxyvinyltransferase
VILMFEKMFESRMFFVDKLIAMGARIVLCDPHRAIVAGPSRLRGALMTSPDIRAGMAMLLAAVCAKGTSTINNARRPGLEPGPPCEREALIAAPRRVL